MSFLARILPGFLNTTIKSAAPKITQAASNFHSLTGAATKGVQEANSINPGGLFNQATRSIIRCHFPRPSERKRIQRHGYKKRMSTAEGRRILMNRILKGKWVYSH